MLSITATELNRFMNCNGSSKMAGLRTINEDTKSIDEGNAAHWLIQECFEGRFKPEELIDRKASNGFFITEEMVDFCQVFLNDVLGKSGGVECNTSHSGSGWEVRGRADYISFKDDVLTVADFKYGWRIVEPEYNWTLISHAVGFMADNVNLYKKICFKIYQPRPYHPSGQVREWLIDYSQFLELREKLWQTLSNPSETLKTGSQCYKCPAMSNCPAAQVAVMNSIDVSYSVFNSNPDNTELSYILDEIARAKAVISQAEDAYNNLAFDRLQKGGYIKGYSLQNSLGNTEWKSNVTAETILLLSGMDLSVKQLISPTQAKKRGLSESILNTLTERKSKGFKLVKQDLSKKAEKLLGSARSRTETKL